MKERGGLQYDICKFGVGGRSKVEVDMEDVEKSAGIGDSWWRVNEPGIEFDEK